MSHPGSKAPGPGGAGPGLELWGGEGTKQRPRPSVTEMGDLWPWGGCGSPRVKAPHPAGAHQPPKWTGSACSPSGCPTRDWARQALLFISTRSQAFLDGEKAAVWQNCKLRGLLPPSHEKHKGRFPLVSPGPKGGGMKLELELCLWPGPHPGSNPSPWFSQESWLPKHLPIWGSIRTQLTLWLLFCSIFQRQKLSFRGNVSYVILQ